ncbi:MAG: prephenate dehydrogenase/arogenate dehydrogenase family protein [Haloarculaceae archaeon]
MRLLVVGAGAMGRWFADSVASEHDAEVAFSDTDPEAAERAASTLDGAVVDSGSGETFDAVCVAVPMPAAESVLEDLAPRAERAICDVTGRMQGPVAAMREHAPDLERLSLHPLFAPENAPGNVAVVPDEDGPVTDDIRAALAARGNTLFETTAAEHDEAMETVQARAHTAVLAFALAAEDVPEQFQTPISAGLFDLVEQVTGGDPRVYADIQQAFDGAEDIAAAAREIADADEETFAALYEDAQ